MKLDYYQFYLFIAVTLIVLMIIEKKRYGENEAAFFGYAFIAMSIFAACHCIYSERQAELYANSGWVIYKNDQEIESAEAENLDLGRYIISFNKDQEIVYLQSYSYVLDGISSQFKSK